MRSSKPIESGAAAALDPPSGVAIPPRRFAWALLALLPLLLVTGFAVTEALRALRANEEVQLEDTAEIFAAALDARLSTYVAAMTTLSLAPSLMRDDNHASFHERAVAVGDVLGGGVMLLGPAPDFILHASSAIPLSRPLPDHRSEGDWTALDAVAARVATSRRPAVSDLFPSHTAGAPTIAVLVPLIREGEVKGMVAFSFAPDTLLPAISASRVQGTLFAGIADSQGRLVTHTRGAAGPPVGTVSSAWSGGAIAGRQHGIMIASRTDGRPTMFAFRHLSEAEGWVVFVGQTSEAQVQSATRLVSWILGALAALGLGAGLLASVHRREALLLARQEAEALRAGRAEIERLLGGLPAVIFLREVAPDGTMRLLYRGGDIETVTGWPSEQLRDLENWNAYYPPGQSPQAFFESVMRTGGGSHEWQMVLPNGAHRAMRTYARRLTQHADGGGEMVGYILNVEAELSAAARAAAAGRLASLGEMAAGIAHELKQPLQSVSLLAENALMTAARGGTEKVAERLDQIVGQIGHASNIIDNLRRFARGTPEGVAPVSVDLAQSVRQTLALAEAALREAGVVVEVDLGEPAPIVMGHAVGIEQTLLNLIINARDAMAQQPPAKPRRIRIWAEPAAEGRVVLKLSDTGEGIRPDVLSRLFEPFVTTKGPDKGTGLGLSISHGLITAMGGTIEACNAAGGAVFTITLCAAPGGVT